MARSVKRLPAYVGRDVIHRTSEGGKCGSDSGSKAVGCFMVMRASSDEVCTQTVVYSRAGEWLVGDIPLRCAEYEAGMEGYPHTGRILEIVA